MLNYGNLSFHWDVIASNIKNVKQSSNQNNSTRDKYAWNGSKLNVTFTGLNRVKIIWAYIDLKLSNVSLH